MSEAIAATRTQHKAIVWWAALDAAIVGVSTRKRAVAGRAVGDVAIGAVARHVAAAARAKKVERSQVDEGMAAALLAVDRGIAAGDRDVAAAQAAIGIARRTGGASDVAACDAVTTNVAGGVVLDADAIVSRVHGIGLATASVFVLVFVFVF